jgi:shikimate dehydrogenase
VAAAVSGLSADGRSVRAAVLGSPISHSLSPVLHLAAYAALGLTWWRYDAIECNEATLPGFLDSCGPDWAGLSLTMPLKRTVLPLLDRAEPLVTEVGGANTVICAAAQRLGYNTDVPGMVRVLAEHGVGRVLPGTAALAASRQSSRAGDAGPALILGGGATACSALAALRNLGERSATAAVRDPGRTSELRSAADRLGMELTLTPIATPEIGTEVRLVISTVPAGVADPYAECFPALVLNPPALLDVVYHPWPTPLASAASQVGAVVAGGFDLLLHQATAQVELMTGRPAPVDVMRAAGLAELARRSSAM